MKIHLISIGTRGDMEPFLALGAMLERRGHQVVCLFPEQFRGLAEEAKLEFHTLGSEFIDLLDGPDGKLVMGGKGNIFKKMGAYIRLYRNSVDINRKMIAIIHDFIENDKPDRIAYNGKATYPILWSIQNPGKATLVSPVPYMIFPVGDHPHLGFKGNLGAFFNRLTYKLADFGLVQNIKSTTRKYRQGQGIGGRKIRNALLTNPTVFSISPSLYPASPEWPSNVSVQGYHQRETSDDWTADPALETFLSGHGKVLMLTFGSMVNPEPEEKTRLFMQVLAELKIPALINTGTGGLVEPDTYDRTQFFFVSRIPYGWIMPRVYAVVHHGGSGTTHMGLRNGCPTLIVPHIVDQFAWNHIVAKAGAGPTGPPMKSVRKSKLKPLIADLFHNPAYLDRAKGIAEQMRREDFEDSFVSQVLGND